MRSSHSTHYSFSTLLTALLLPALAVPPAAAAFAPSQADALAVLPVTDHPELLAPPRRSESVDLEFVSFFFSLLHTHALHHHPLTGSHLTSDA